MPKIHESSVSGTGSNDRPLFQLSHYRFKIADTPEEIEQVHRLNYETFVREIRQHEDPGTGYLVDKFHHKNRYLVALRDDRVIGMVAVHDQPPYSIAERLGDPSILQRLGTRLLEVRLLAIQPGERHRLVFAGLMWSLYLFARNASYAHLIASGVTERLTMYERLGFRVLGPAVRCGDAAFVPMALSLGQIPDPMRRDIELWQHRVDAELGGASRGQHVCLLPGPVQISAEVRDRFSRPPISHRAREFVEEFERVRSSLRAIGGGLDVALFLGSGTLANDVVATTLAAQRDRRSGLILTNGEFGDRLVKQANRVGLAFRVLNWPWGDPWDLDEVAAQLADDSTGWVWGVHLESSTGVLNDLPGLIHLAQRRGMRVCADCVSSLGAVPVDLQGVHLASGVSGKALGAYSGVAIVFAAPNATADMIAHRLPSYLDLPATLASAGPRFTFPAAELGALDQALRIYATPEGRRMRYEQYAELGRFVRHELHALGIEPVADDASAAPTITTFVAPHRQSSSEFVDQCASWGFEVAGLSEYLSRRRWVQIATMGCVTLEDCGRFFAKFGDWMRMQSTARPSRRSRWVLSESCQRASHL